MRSCKTPSGCTISIRAESRGLAGRSAILPAGSSKSKRSVRMAQTLAAHLIPGERRLHRVSKDEIERSRSWFETRASHAPHHEGSSLSRVRGHMRLDDLVRI